MRVLKRGLLTGLLVAQFAAAAQRPRVLSQRWMLSWRGLVLLVTFAAQGPLGATGKIAPREVAVRNLLASLVVSLERLRVAQASVRPGEVGDVTRVLARTPDHVVVGVIPEVGDDVGADGKPVGRDVGDAAIGRCTRGSWIHAERCEYVGDR
jgi:hypothetical protein